MKRIQLVTMFTGYWVSGISIRSILFLIYPEWALYSIPNTDASGAFGTRRLKPEPGLPYSVYVGAAGMVNMLTFVSTRPLSNP